MRSSIITSRSPLQRILQKADRRAGLIMQKLHTAKVEGLPLPHGKALRLYLRTILPFLQKRFPVI